MSPIYPPLISPRIVRVQLLLRLKNAERCSAQALNLPDLPGFAANLRCRL